MSYVSLNPLEGDLDRLLARGEQDKDFKLTNDGERETPPRRILDVAVEGVITAVGDEANLKDVARAAVQRVATKLGLLRMGELPEWPDLRKAYGEQRIKARQDHDRLAIVYLENSEMFRFAHPHRKKMGVSAYAWVQKEIDEAAEAAGISHAAALMMCLVLGLATLNSWEGFFEEDIDAFRRHLRRRKALLEGGL